MSNWEIIMTQEKEAGIFFASGTAQSGGSVHQMIKLFTILVSNGSF